MKTGYRLLLEHAPNGCNIKVDVDADNYDVCDIKCGPSEDDWFIFYKRNKEVFAVRVESVFSIEKIGEFNEDNK